MRASVPSVVPLTWLCAACGALLGLLCSCTDHITVGKQDLAGGGDASKVTDAGVLSMVCDQSIPLTPSVNSGSMVSEVVPGANACEIAVDPAGLLVAACASSNATTVGVDALAPGQSQELFVQKRATNGSLVFHTPIAGITPSAIEVTASGDTFVLGALNPPSDADPGFSLVRLTPTGDIAWNKKFYKMYDGANAHGALAIAADGTLWITGSTNFIAAQFDASGNELQTIWLKSGGEQRWGAGQAIRILDNGDVLVAGVFNQPIDLGGGLLGNDASTESSGFWVRYTTSGQYAAGQVFAPSFVDNVGLANGPNRSIVIAGTMNAATVGVFGCSMPNSDIAPGFIAKLDDSLSVEWAKLVPA